MPNFIVHFKKSCDVFAEDGRMTYVHLALYMSLFYHWNNKKFVSEMRISRDEVMHIACLVSKKAYYRVLHDLHDWGYITYAPSRHPGKPSWVTVHDPEAPVYRTPTGTTADSTGGSTAYAGGVPSINNTNLLNGINERRGTTPAPAPERDRSGDTRHSRPVDLKEAVDYFREQNQSPFEAEKFYNYYQGSGWERRDRTPIRDWQAVARSWILKIEAFGEKKRSAPKGPQPHHLATDNNKDFAEPL